MGRRTFTAEFKREAVRLVTERGLPVTRAAKQLDVHPNVLGKWVRDFESDPAHAFPGQGKLKPEQAEIERLKRELARVKMERDILKKATAFFAKESS
jgi:transposase